MSKNALLVGINYIGTSYSLRGCWNDVYNMEKYIKTRGYSNIRVMTDETKNLGTELYPTLPKIKQAIQQLVSSAKSGDSLFFHYSGHGGFVRDVSGDELDGRDECIYPCDGSKIIDDDLRAWLCDALPEGVTMRCVFDCCHSGSGLDLPYRCLPGGKSIRENKRPLSRNVIAISGCEDRDTSADAFLNSTYQGALSAILLKVLATHSDMRWKDLIQIVQYEMKRERFSQVPQLSLSDLSLRSQKFDV
jgi:hypothetical protein